MVKKSLNYLRIGEAEISWILGFRKFEESISWQFSGVKLRELSEV